MAAGWPVACDFPEMKALILLATCLALAAAPASAGWIIVQKVEGGGETGEITVKLGDGWARTDLANHVSKITNLETGDEVTLMHERKQSMAISAASARALADRVRRVQKEQTPEGAPVDPPKLEAAGRTAKFGGYDTEIFTYDMGAISAEYWFAKDYPHAAEVLAQMQKFQDRGISAIAQGMLPSPADFPGMPLKTIVRSGDETVTTTVVSVKEASVPASEFKVPEGYEPLPEPAIEPIPSPAAEP